ncbi:MAG: T9SS type A sorting domain-containing protein [Flavobacteriales bacterium]|nr:T9SS type A sorting domain-containing protein [Flavobacteriales bacterium]
MKTKLLFTIITFAITSFLGAQTVLDSTYFIGHFSSSHIAPFGGDINGDTIVSFNNSFPGKWLTFKIDENGDTIVTKLADYGFRGSDAIGLNSGGFAQCGQSRVAITDSNFDTLWTTTNTHSGTFYNRIDQASNQDLYVLGNKNIWNATSSIVLSRFDLIGALQFDKELDQNDFPWNLDWIIAHNMIELSNGYLIAGEYGLTSAFIVHTDFNGDTIKTFNIQGYGRGQNVFLNQSGNYYLVCSDNGMFNIVEIDPNGNTSLFYSKSISGTGNFLIDRISNNIVLSYTSLAFPTTQAYVLVLDQFGNEVALDTLNPNSNFLERHPTKMKTYSHELLILGADSSVGARPFIIHYDSTYFDSLVNSGSKVWPGDANSDGVASIIDVLPIGIAYNSSGPVRVNATLNWVGQAANDFGSQFATGVDYKHADCNGNGFVDFNDLNAILLNYELTHSKGQGGNYIATNPGLSVELSKDTTNIATQVTATIKLGDLSTPADSIYGISFGLNFDPVLVDSASMNVDYSNSWLGDITNSNDFIALDTTLLTAGRLDVGMVRTNQVEMSGHGEICSIDIFTSDDLIGKQDIYETLVLSLSNIKVIRLDESETQVNAFSDSVVIVHPNPSSLGENLDPIWVEVYPNPTNGEISVVSSGRQFDLNIISMTGALVKNYGSVPSGTNIDLSTLEKGMYFLKISDGQGQAMRRLIIK